MVINSGTLNVKLFRNRSFAAKFQHSFSTDTDNVAIYRIPNHLEPLKPFLKKEWTNSNVLEEWFNLCLLTTKDELDSDLVVMMNCSISEKEKLEDSRGCDLLSNLPLSIIHIILALIPIRDAVRTSLLSTEWRYTWTTLPQLVFDDDCANEEDESESKYEDIISRVLFLHKGPIHRFRLSCSCSGHFRNADQWLTSLSRNGIQETIIDSSIVMQSSLYSCEKLTNLRLYFCALDPPPMTFKGFLFLRCLCIIGVDSLTSDDISRIVECSPLLESLELITNKETKLKIKAPNLKYMNLVGDYQKICINAPLMTEISVYLCYSDMEAPNQELQSSACECALCFAGFTNLQKLRGSGYFTKFMSLGIELFHHSLGFHHLKLIHVDVDFENVKEILVLARLVIGAPSLQELIIKSLTDIYGLDSEAPNSSLEDLDFAPNFRLENLTDVSLVDFDVLPLEAEFLKILFESSPVLETVRVDTEEDQNKVRAILQGCNSASPPIVKPRGKRTSPDRFRPPF